MDRENFHAVRLSHEGSAPDAGRAFDTGTAARVRRYHRSFPEYTKTPLVSLPCLAEQLGAAAIYIKDESKRFGLNAFKALGGSYAVGCAVCERLGLAPEDMTFSNLTSDTVRTALGDLTLVTATDGNHGRGVAWTAKQLGLSAVIYLPRGTSAERVRNIRALGAEASVTDLSYDDTVRLAARQAETHGWLLIQDTSWEGYETVPQRIMQGYLTMGSEIAEQLDGDKPTHIFLQAGVGSMAGALAAYFSSLYGEDSRPLVTVLEPNKADCIFRTAQADDGRLHAAEGDISSLMAGLSCGEPCTLGWKLLRRYADCFVSVPEYTAALGMRVLGCPCGCDRRIVSGESGASTAGLVYAALAYPSLAWLKELLSLDENSRILCISTEGDTDRSSYRSIVWEGAYPSPLCR